MEITSPGRIVKFQFELKILIWYLVEKPRAIKVAYEYFGP